MATGWWCAKNDDVAPKVATGARTVLRGLGRQPHYPGSYRFLRSHSDRLRAGVTENQMEATPCPMDSLSEPLTRDARRNCRASSR